MERPAVSFVSRSGCFALTHPRGLSITTRLAKFGFVPDKILEAAKNRIAETEIAMTDARKE
jgi:hypothetical protein